jgi:hypothetical protein
MVVSADELNDLIDSLDERLPQDGCGHTLRLTRTWIARRALEPDSIVESLEESGGYCDSEALANVEPDEIF